jgi:hypothetical protein
MTVEKNVYCHECEQYQPEAEVKNYRVSVQGEYGGVTHGTWLCDACASKGKGLTFDSIKGLYPTPEQIQERIREAREADEQRAQARARGELQDEEIPL